MGCRSGLSNQVDSGALAMLGDLVAFRFQEASCVAVGTFNMYIIQPAWLAKVEIIPEGTEVTIASKLDEPGFRFSSPKLPIRWVVTPNRVEVHTRRADEDCGEPLAQVIDRLPWTPLVALGNNAIYRAPLDDLAAIPAAAALWTEAPDGFVFAQRSLHGGLKREETVFNVELAITEEELELSVNATSKLRGRESAEAQRAARRFLEDRETFERLIEQLFQVSVTYAEPDPRPMEAIDGADRDG